jgi:hypothetical protein
MLRPISATWLYGGVHMAIGDNLLYLDRAERRRIGKPPAADLGEAAELISDLVALVDAGLLVVDEEVSGPARYGVSARFADPA